METHSSIQYLKKLEVLDLKYCESLTSLATGLHSECLWELKLSGCLELKNFPEIPSSYVCILTLTEVGIKELPSSIECLSNLQALYIENCSRLENISSSIFKLQSLDRFEIHDCSKLKRFLEIPSCNTDGSTEIERLSSSELRLEDCSSLESLPSSLCMFKSLTSLEIFDCKKFERLPDELGNLEYLKVLTVHRAAIREVSESLGQLALLNRLRLDNYSSLESLPSSLCMFKSLTSLVILDCKKLERLPDGLGNLKALWWLTLVGTAIRERPENLGQLSPLAHLNLCNNNLERIPESFDQLSSLQYLQLLENNLDRILEYLRSFPTSILSKLTWLSLSVDLRNCLKLDPNELSEIVKDGWMKQLFHGESWYGRWIMRSMYFPGNEIPKWFRYQRMGSSITLKTPPPVFFNNKKIMGFAFCAVVAFPAPECCRHQSVEGCHDRYLYDVRCDLEYDESNGYEDYVLGRIHYVESDYVFLGSFLFDWRIGDVNDITFHIERSYEEEEEEEQELCPRRQCRGWCEVKKCGIHFVYAKRKRNHFPKD